MLSRRIDGDIEQWFATDTSGVYRLARQEWTAFRPDGAIGTWSVGEASCPHHAATVSTGCGPPAIRGWRVSMANDGCCWDGDIGLPGVGPAGAAPDPDARKRPILWLGSTRHGLIRVDISDPLHPRTLPADLPPPAGPHRRRCAGRCQRPASTSAPTPACKYSRPDAGRYRSQVFTVRDGMVNNECNANAQFVDTHGRFWTGTLGGLMVHDPRQAKPDHDAKPLRLVQVQLDDRPVAHATSRIPPGRMTCVSISRCCPGSTKANPGFVPGWKVSAKRPGAWTPDNFRDIGALPHGHYVLHIEARDYAGNPQHADPAAHHRATVLVAAIVGACCLRWSRSWS